MLVYLKKRTLVTVGPPPLKCLQLRVMVKCVSETNIKGFFFVCLNVVFVRNRAGVTWNFSRK